jgi:hypothetical protein
VGLGGRSRLRTQKIIVWKVDGVCFVGCVSWFREGSWAGRRGHPAADAEKQGSQREREPARERRQRPTSTGNAATARQEPPPRPPDHLPTHPAVTLSLSLVHSPTHGPRTRSNQGFFAYTARHCCVLVAAMDEYRLHGWTFDGSWKRCYPKVGYAMHASARVSE